MAPVAYFCSERAYFDNLLPVWRAHAAQIAADAPLPLHVAPHLLPEIEDLVAPYRPFTARIRSRPVAPLVVVASYSDYVAQRTLPTVYLEHGCGQTYAAAPNGFQSGSYAGGPGKERAVAFACPNDHVAALNRATYPNAKIRVTGRPLFDDLLQIPAATGAPTVVMAFHWAVRHAHFPPEMGSAWSDYAPHLTSIATDLAAQNVRLVVHSHPRARAVVEPDAASAGVTYEPDYRTAFGMAYVWAADNSTSMYDAAALDIPTLVLHASQYDESRDYPPRFGPNAILPGPIVPTPDALVPAVLSMLADPHASDHYRLAVQDHLYPHIGQSAHLTATFIREVAESL